MDAYVNVNVSSEALLKHAQTDHEKRKNDIFSSISKERNDLLAELRRKHAKEENELRSQMSSKQAELLNAASDEYGEIKAKIEEEYNKKMAAKTPWKKLDIQNKWEVSLLYKVFCWSMIGEMNVWEVYVIKLEKNVCTCI